MLDQKTKLTPPFACDTIVFDLDGTLVDSLPDMAIALNRVLTESGRRELALEHVRSLIGEGAEKMIRGAFELTGPAVEPAALTEIHRRYIDYYKNEPAGHSSVYDGVFEVLEKFTRAGIKMGVCSNKAYELVELILECFELRKYFCGVSGGDDVNYNKPDGRHILETLVRMRADNGQALMIGDSFNDVAAARDFGIPVIAVDYGYTKNSSEILEADWIINSFRLIPEFVSETPHLEFRSVSET